MAVVIRTFAERPDLADALWDLIEVWPRFMRQDPVADMYYAGVEETHPEFVLVAYDESDPERLVARAFSVPFAMGDEGREQLPPGGWDDVIRWAWLDRLRGRQPTAVSALEISIRAAHRSRGLSAQLLAAMRANVARLGFTDLVAPVRPTGKSAEPRTPMTKYAAQLRGDGLPVDPWLRVHVRAGGRVVGVAPRAMVIPGTLAEWREWTGLSFDVSGPVEVPGALVPVQCSVEHGYAVYVEPGVWVHHRVA